MPQPKGGRYLTVSAFEDRCLLVVKDVTLIRPPGDKHCGPSTDLLQRPGVIVGAELHFEPIFLGQ